MKLSIITINYNNRDGLRNTIESVVNQTWQDFEYIIIDGGSTDGSVEVIKEFADHIDYWVSERDKGIYNAMNKGVNQVNGEYCLFLNSADVLYNSSVIEQVTSKLDGHDVICGDMVRDFDYTKKMSPAPIQISMCFFYNHTLPHQATFIRSEILRAHPYDESYRIVSDWKFFIETLIWNNCTYKYINVIISNFDVSGISLSNTTLMAKECHHVLSSMFPESVLNDYEKFVVGISWEDKLYIDIKHSAFHKIFYSLNVLIIRLGSFFKRNSSWIKKYPLRLPE